MDILSKFADYRFQVELDEEYGGAKVTSYLTNFEMVLLGYGKPLFFIKSENGERLELLLKDLEAFMKFYNGFDFVDWATDGKR